MNELYHHGVKGMKWGVRHDRKKSGGISGRIRSMQTNNAKNISEISSKQKQVRSELSELKRYDKNPSSLGKSKISTIIRRNQIKSLERTQAKLKSNKQEHLSALKELNAIEKYQQNKSPKSKNAITSKQSMQKAINKGMEFYQKMQLHSLADDIFYNSAGKKTVNAAGRAATETYMRRRGRTNISWIQ